MASQYSEHLSILKYFEGKPGRFLDVGAGDGLTYSNTEPLLRAGWSGVMVEPAISQLRELIGNHGNNSHVEIVTAALDFSGCYRLQDIHDGREYSTLCADHRNLIETHSKGEVVFRTRPIVAIDWDDLRWVGERETFDFINLDVEGMNLDLLEELPFAELQPQMVCVEIDPEAAMPRMQEIFAEAGLHYTKRIGGNLLAARNPIA